MNLIMDGLSTAHKGDWRMIGMYKVLIKELNKTISCMQYTVHRKAREKGNKKKTINNFHN